MSASDILDRAFEKAADINKRAAQKRSAALARAEARPASVVYPIRKVVPLTIQMAKDITRLQLDGGVSSENEMIRRLIQIGISSLN